MKKILSVMSALTFGTITATSVVGCGTNKVETQKPLQDYIDEIIKEGINVNKLPSDWKEAIYMIESYLKEVTGNQDLYVAAWGDPSFNLNVWDKTDATLKNIKLRIFASIDDFNKDKDSGYKADIWDKNVKFNIVNEK